MKIEITLVKNENGFIVKNMYPLYLHDLAGIHGTLPNRYGIFEEENIRTLQEQYNIQQVWFEHPGELFPYLIMADDLPAGFCLIGSGKYVPEETDFHIYETFILNPYRNQGIASYAVPEILNKHHGRWMLFTQSAENNQKALHFWTKTIAIYTNGQYSKAEQLIDGMPKTVYKFKN